MSSPPSLGDVTLMLAPDVLVALRALADLQEDGADAEVLAALVLREGLAARFAEAGRTWPADSAEEGAASPQLEARRPRGRWSRPELQVGAIAASAVALVVLLVGSHRSGWGWTGFAGNNQLWDWLHLLLLPIAFGTFPLWLRYGAYMSWRRKAALAAAVVAFAGFVAAGYLVPLGWTGFTGNTLWDWLTLLVLPLAIMTVRMWPASSREIHTVHLVAATAFAVAWVTTSSAAMPTAGAGRATRETHSGTGFRSCWGRSSSRRS